MLMCSYDNEEGAQCISVDGTLYLSDILEAADRIREMQKKHADDEIEPYRKEFVDYYSQEYGPRASVDAESGFTEGWKKCKERFGIK